MLSPVPSPEEVISIVTQFYCSLTCKKDISKIIEEIRHFVMNRDTITHKEYIAKLLVDYFLKL